MSPISWIVLSQFRSSTAYISRQKAASLTKNSPKYSAPACSITKKQLVDGLTKDTKTVFRMPTSPRGWVVSKPPHHNQFGGQLRPFQYVNSGWFRSNMTGPPSVRAPSPCRPGALSPDRLLTHFIRTTFALPCRGKTVNLKKKFCAR